MSTLNASALSLLDLKTHMDPKGAPATIIEILAQSNPILEDMTWEEGNLPTGHQHTARTGYPTPTWRKLNYGVAATKGTVAQVTDTCGMLEDYGQVDARLVRLNGHKDGWRAQQDKAHIIGMGETLASTLFYGNTDTNPERFMGLAPRFNTISLSTAKTAQNVIAADSGASGATQTSIWLIGWGDAVRGIYPKGTKAGLDWRDLGEDTAVDSNGLMYQVFRSHFQWDCGLAVSDWRYIVRIANIDVDNLTKSGSTGSDLVDALVTSLETIQSLEGVRPVFYANRRVTSYLRRQMNNKTNVHLNWGEIGGKKVMSFGDVPVRRCDAILNTESVLS